CVDYESWDLTHAEKARQMLAEHPELARANIYTASAAGDADAERGMLTLANTKGGPYEWEPLLYACYSRVAPTLDAARVLIEAGADPDAGFLWHGNVPPFTALTGAFGGGEAGAHNPPHAQSLELARLLLDAGADPNDGQTLYNRHFEPNDDHLKLLFAYGLGEDKGGPWFRRFGDRLFGLRKMLAEELWAAANQNYIDRARLLVEHRTDANLPSFRDGRTPYECAVRAGNDEIAAYLLAHGATRVALSDDDRFANACVRGDRDRALALLASDPARAERLGVRGRVELIQGAVEANHPEGIRLMAELGFEVNGDGGATPLHQAAWKGDVEMARLLIALGADPSIRDPNHDGTPLDWAEFNRQEAAASFLREAGLK